MEAFRLTLSRVIVVVACALVAASLAPAAGTAAAATGSGSQFTFDSGTDGWTSSNASLAQTDSPVHSGSGALAATLNGSSSADLAAASPEVAVTPGTRWSAGAWVRGASASRNASVLLVFKTSSGANTAVQWGQAVADGTTGWVHAPAAVGIAPQDAATAQLMVIVWGSAGGETAYVDDATLDPTPGSSAAVVGPLHVSGNGLIDGNGQPLVLRGIQRFGLEGGNSNPPPTDAEIGQLKAWGANEVRISLGEQLWMSNACAYDKDYASKVDAIVNSVTSRGMVALVNLHYTVTSRCGSAGLQPMADSALSVPFWQQVAARYANNPLVVFDLFNEPHDVSESVWLNGGKIRWQGTTYKAAGMQQLYDAVRGTGARNVVLVSGLNWASQPPSKARVSGTDIMYGAHAYTCPNSPPPNCSSSTPYDPSYLLNPWGTLAKTSPVMISEFGWPDRNDGIYNANVIDYAETHGWAGWDAFAFDGSTSGLFALLDGVAGDGVTYEPTAAGMTVLTGLARNAP